MLAPASEAVRDPTRQELGPRRLSPDEDMPGAEVVLLRLDPTKNMRRRWSVSIDVDLFGAVHLRRAWGRIGARGSAKLYPFDTIEEARAEMVKLVATKTRRGYSQVRGFVGCG